ncbi:hypothetical protein N9N67_09500 [Bacteriovoracaceae bacterium]|nr:hypothetical protein [Bacteriovoracaceae bacterium]
MVKLFIYPTLFTLGFLTLPMKERFTQKNSSVRTITIPQEIVVNPSPVMNKQLDFNIASNKNKQFEITSSDELMEKKKDKTPFIDHEESKVTLKSQTTGFKKFQVKTKAKYFTFNQEDLEQEKIVEVANQIIREKGQKRLPSQIPTIISFSTESIVNDYSSPLISQPELAFDDSTILLARLIYKVDSQNLLAHLTPRSGNKDEIQVKQASSKKDNSSNDDLVIFDYSALSDQKTSDSKVIGQKASLIRVDEIKQKSSAPIEPSYDLKIKSNPKLNHVLFIVKLSHTFTILC